MGEVVRPSEHGGLDNRVLGIVIFRIAFEPVLDVVEPTPEPVQPVAAPLLVWPVAGDAGVFEELLVLGVQADHRGFLGKGGQR